jgi:hypothetical protein
VWRAWNQSIYRCRPRIKYKNNINDIDNHATFVHSCISNNEILFYSNSIFICAIIDFVYF